jgi:hypothetical protein
MYKKFRKLGELSSVLAGKSGDTGGWEMGVAALGVPAMGLEATGTYASLPLA